MADMAKLKADPRALAIGGTVAGLVLGLLIGKFALGANLGNVTATNSVDVSPQQSGEIIANYTYDGQTKTVTLEDMFTYNDSASSANEDGSYPMPTAEQIISYVRTQIIQDAARKADITVSDEDRSEYLTKQFGTDNVDDVALSLGRTAEQVDTLMTEAITQTKLYEKVAGEVPDLPDYPEYPADGDEEAKGETYATYITQVAGDEFKDGKWVDAEGEFAGAIADFDGQEASYKDATLAYQVLYNRASERMNELSAKWRDYENEILKDCAITMGTLIQ